MLRLLVKYELLRQACRREVRAALCTISAPSKQDPHARSDEGNHGQKPGHNVSQGAPNRPEHRKRPVFEDSAYQSISSSEIAKFAAMAETWWDSKGPFKPLHLMNPTRIAFIRSALCGHFKKIVSCAKPLEGLTILDVGCGGGLLCEPLARMGAQVVGIDAVEENIKLAAAHAMKDPATASIKYFCTTADQMSQEEYEGFDAVVSLEVIEHVTEPKQFLQSLSPLVKADGAVFISTINRSISGYLLAIVAAEHLLRWVPKGTHEWSKFVTPDELALLMSQTGFTLQEMAGMVFNPLTGKWSLSEDTSVNYIAFGTKTGQAVA
eukprot:c10508_g2_i1 orf=156-1121(-)